MQRVVNGLLYDTANATVVHMEEDTTRTWVLYFHVLKKYAERFSARLSLYKYFFKSSMRSVCSQLNPL